MVYAGVDLGGTNIKAALITADGEILCEGSRPTLLPRSSGEICADIAGLVDELAGKAGYRGQVAGLGIGCPGSVDDNGTVVYANNLGWVNFPAGQTLQEMTGLPVAVGNDANVAASELGHMVVAPGGVPCTCGQRGCLEMYASATGLVRMTREAMDRDPASRMHALAARSGVDGRLAFAAAAQGDPAARQVVDDYLGYLALGLSNLINILFPEVIGLSGGVANQGEALLAPLRRLVEPAVYGHELGGPRTRLVCCTLGYQAGVIGAAMLARQKTESGT